MRVCLLNDSFPPVIDGVSNTVLNYARVLSGMDDCDVFVGTPRYPNTDYGSYPYEIVPYSSFGTGKRIQGYRAGNPFDVKVIGRAVRFRPDVIHTHCPITSAILARMVRAETGAPLVLTYHTKFDIDIAKAMRAEWLQKVSTKLLVGNISACDEVWTVSRGAGENLRSLGYEGEYRVVLNGVDFPKGRVPDAEAAELLKEYDIPEEVPLFLYVGRMMTYKGLPLLIDALRLLADGGQDFRMVFVGGGSGNDSEVLKKQSREAGFPVYEYRSDGTVNYSEGVSGRKGKIIFTGLIRDRKLLRAWNTRADLFVFPSTFDTNGIVVREAAACGLASLLIAGSCAAEGVLDGVNGYTAEENAAAYAAKLKEICADRGAMKRVGANAMDQIYLSWEDSIRTAYGYYEELIDKKRSGLLPPKKKFSETALRTTARIDMALLRVFGKPKSS